MSLIQRVFLLRLALLPLLLLFVLGCGGAEGTEADRIFTEELQRFLEERCAEGCHEPEGFNGHLFLGEDYGQDEFVEVASRQAPLLLVTPGNLDESYLWHKVQGTHREVGGEGERMPYAGSMLSDAELDVIQRYILALE